MLTHGSGQVIAYGWVPAMRKEQDSHSQGCIPKKNDPRSWWGFCLCACLCHACIQWCYAAVHMFGCGCMHVISHDMYAGQCVLFCVDQYYCITIASKLVVKCMHSPSRTRNIAASIHRCMHYTWSTEFVTPAVYDYVFVSPVRGMSCMYLYMYVCMYVLLRVYVSECA